MTSSPETSQLYGSLNHHGASGYSSEFRNFGDRKHNLINIIQNIINDKQEGREMRNKYHSRMFTSSPVRLKL